MAKLTKAQEWAHQQNQTYLRDIIRNFPFSSKRNKDNQSLSLIFKTSDAEFHIKHNGDFQSNIENMYPETFMIRLQNDYHGLSILSNNEGYRIFVNIRFSSDIVKTFIPLDRIIATMHHHNGETISFDMIPDPFTAQAEYNKYKNARRPDLNINEDFSYSAEAGPNVISLDKYRAARRLRPDGNEPA